MALIFNGGGGRIDTVFGGPHATPTGTTKRTGTPDTPTRLKVALFSQKAFQVVREQWSDADTGSYQFTGLRAGTYFVATFDHTGQYNGEIVTDIVVPAP